MKKLIILIAAAVLLLFGTFANAGATLVSDSQVGVTHYEVVFTSEEPDVVSTSTALLDGSMEHDISWLPAGLHDGYARAGKEWLLRQGPAPDMLGPWVAQAVYRWSDPTYFEIDGGTLQIAANLAVEVR